MNRAAPAAAGPPRSTVSFSLADLAAALGVELDGEGAKVIDHVAAITAAGEGGITYLHDRRMGGALGACRASAVILRADDRDRWLGAALLSDNPSLTFARAAALLYPPLAPPPGVHRSAVVAADAVLGEGVSVAAHVVIEAGAVIGARASIGPGAVVGSEVEIGADTRIEARVVVAARCRIGARCRLEPGTVVGSDGFGFARDGDRWERIPQLGRVVVADDVEIGANVTIDRGALGDTVIEAGVKIDNLVHIGHNCRIGTGAAIAGQVGFAGSTTLGAGCTVGGQAGFADHLEIAPGCHFTGRAMVTHSFAEPGVYSSGLPAQQNRAWRRAVAALGQIDGVRRRLRDLERTSKADSADQIEREARHDGRSTEDDRE